MESQRQAARNKLQSELQIPVLDASVVNRAGDIPLSSRGHASAVMYGCPLAFVGAEDTSVFV